MNVAVFVSGRGSNLKAVLTDESLHGLIEVKAVFSNKENCPAFKIADEFLIQTFSIGNAHATISYDEVYQLLLDKQVELIVLAGYLKLIPSKIVNSANWKIINIHPALLPSFGGKGMYGMNVHNAVFNSSAKISGATVHFVDSTYDTGKIIAQRCVDISDIKSPEEIAVRVLEIEHELLPYVIKKIAEKKVRFSGTRIFVDE